MHYTIYVLRTFIYTLWVKIICAGLQQNLMGIDSYSYYEDVCYVCCNTDREGKSQSVQRQMNILLVGGFVIVKGEPIE